MAASSSPSPPLSSLLFQPASETSPHASVPLFAPRLGKLTIHRQDGSHLQIDTPSMMIATSRGVVPHLSRDQVSITDAIRWVHVPFESFLEHNPPVPTLQSGTRPLHKFLGYQPSQHVISMSARDPFDGRDMPANNKEHISVYCIRGVRKLTPDAWAKYAGICNPDIVTALSDIPFTPPPHSQKRLTKSLERSTAWLMHLLKVQASSRLETSALQHERGHVLLHMAGGASEQAREAFANSILEELEPRDADPLSPLHTLDEGVAGYVFDLLPLRTAVLAEAGNAASLAVLEQTRDVINTMALAPAPDLVRTAETAEGIVKLLRASLGPLAASKPRFVNSPKSPHEILRLIRDVGVDMIDAHWAQRAADIGVALDFCFPVPRDLTLLDYKVNEYAHDHSRLAACFQDGESDARQGAGAETQPGLSVCPCAACSPRSPLTRIHHSAVDHLSFADQAPSAIYPPHMRSYLHHLLHTHEMSAHSLLVMHNLAMMDAFLAGVRRVLAGLGGCEAFAEEVGRFVDAYDEEMGVFAEAKGEWAEVERARGKGRLAREKIKQAESSLGTAVEL